MRILNGAMSMSILVYGVVLLQLKKLEMFAPGAETPLEMIALASSLLLGVSLWLYHSKCGNEVAPQQRNQFYVVCLAMNESIALLGFVATFLSPINNGFFYLTCTLVALVGNIAIFPKR